MPLFGKRSRQERDSCDMDLQEILNEAIKHIDFSVVHGHRDMEQQNTAFNEGRSRNRWPTSKHNSAPSFAFDIVPYPGGYQASYEKFYEMATYILQSASYIGIPLIWGGHWKNYTGRGPDDRDWSHFEKVT